MSNAIFNKNTKTWSIRTYYTDAVGVLCRKRKSGFKSKWEAERWANDYRNSFASFSIVKMADLIDYVWNVKKDSLEAKTAANYKYYLRIIKSDFVNRDIDNISARELQLYVNSFISTPSKCEYIYRMLSLIFNIAFKHGIINSNIFLRLDKPKIKHKEVNCYDLSTSIKLLNHIKADAPKYYPLAYLLVFAGLRPSEALALTIDDLIDSQGYKFININKALVAYNDLVDKHSQTILKSTKTRSGTRKIPIPNEWEKEILYYRNQNASISKIGESNHLICDENGQPITHNSFRLFLSRIINRYGMPHITAYGLRHTFGNINKSIGTDVYTVAKLMGHSDPSVTLRNYYHDDNTLNKKAITAIANAIVDKQD